MKYRDHYFNLYPRLQILGPSRAPSNSNRCYSTLLAIRLPTFILQQKPKLFMITNSSLTLNTSFFLIAASFLSLGFLFSIYWNAARIGKGLSRKWGKTLLCQNYSTSTKFDYLFCVFDFIFIKSQSIILLFNLLQFLNIHVLEFILPIIGSDYKANLLKLVKGIVDIMFLISKFTMFDLRFYDFFVLGCAIIKLFRKSWSICSNRGSSCPLLYRGYI